MHSIYSFFTGPLLKLSFIYCFLLCTCNVVYVLFLVKKKEGFIFKHFSFKYSLRSIAMWWIFPFTVLNWRNNFAMAICTFTFHLCCILVPFFNLSHIVILEENLNLSWVTLPNQISHLMTIIVVCCCFFFLSRKIFNPTVKFVTTKSDYFILVLVVAPFITGLLSRYQFISYDFFVFLHILSGEFFLFLFPHTRLKHLFLFPLARGYIGSEFGKVRKIHDW